MGNRGIQCTVRTKGMGDDSVDTILDLYLIEKYDTAIQIYDQLEAAVKEQLLDALQLTDEEIHMGAF